MNVGQAPAVPTTGQTWPAIAAAADGLDGGDASGQVERRAMPIIRQLGSFEREPISEPTRLLLNDFAAGDLQRPLRRVRADWQEVFQAVCRNGLVGLAYRYLKRQGSEEYPPAEFRRWVKVAQVVSSARMAWVYGEVRRVLTRFAEAGPDYLVVKGPAVACAVYPDPGLRSFSDLDLVVQERDWPAAHRLLVELGFCPADERSELPPRLGPLSAQYERRYWSGATGFLVELHGDDLLNAGLRTRDLDGFWSRAVARDVAGLPLRMLSLEDQLIQLCAHQHYHGYTRLNWMSDVAFLVRDHAQELDWERLLETVRIEGAEVPVYYTLHFVERLLGVAPPAGVLARVQPDRVRRWLHERYLPEARVLSLQPMPRPDFSFYFRPLFKRLLPDLLVMGRRAEKLEYLVRLLAPPPAWLRHYYRLGEGEHLTPHYLLHPLKLAYRYLEEIAAAVARGRRLEAGRADSRAVAWWSADSSGAP